MIKEVIILSFCLLMVVALTTAEEDLKKSMQLKNAKPADDMDMMETAETKYKGGGGGGHYKKGGGGGHYKKGGGGGGGHYRGGGGGGGKKGGYKGGKGFKKG